MYKRILVPVDGSRTAARGLEEAIRLAKKHKSQLCVLHVVDESIMVQYPETAIYAAEFLKELEKEGQRILDVAAADVRAQGLVPKTALYKTAARVADVVVRHARKWHADVIVLGTHGRRGVKRLVLGSDAELIVRASPVPVLLVRATVPKRGRH